MDYQIISDETGKVLAVLSYATLALAQEVARQYSRVLGVPCYRNTMRCRFAPVIGAVLPELVREIRT
jgi:hypothetical protein